jgi:trigger factor
VKIEIKDKENLLKEISVEVPAETVNGKIEEKLAEKQKEAHLKGYRKGKAPMNMIRSLYQDQIKGDIAEEIIKETYPTAVRDNDLKVASYPMVSDFKFNDDGSILYVASVEVFPEIKNVEYDGLEIEKSEIEIKDEDVDNVVESLQKNMADIRVVERPISDSDVVVLDIEKLDDPTNAIPQDKFENSEVDLSNKLTVKEFKDELPGMSKGDVKEITVKYSDEYPDKVFAGKEIKYKCTIKEVKERILDELNDAFAKKSDQAETMLELRMNIRSRLNEQKEEEQKREQKTVVIDHVIKKNEIMVPNALVEDYLKNMVENFKQQYKDQEIDEAEIKKNYEPIGQNTLKWNMLMHKLSEQEKIGVEESDIDNIIAKFAENYKMTLEQAKASLQQSGNIADLRDSILEDKIIDYIISKSKIIESKK